MSKYKINGLFNEVLIDDGMLLLSDHTTNFYYLGAFENVLWQTIKEEPNDYEMLVQRATFMCENFNLQEFESFWNDLICNEIVLLDKI